MDLDMDGVSEDELDEFMNEEPTKGIFFSVFVLYSLDHPTVKKKVEEQKAFVESDPLPTFHTATEASEAMAEKIRKDYRGSAVYQLPNEEAEDPFTLFVIDKKKRVIARLGVVAEDYRNETIH